jgi:hypothetical protein
VEETMTEANDVTCRPGYVWREAFPGDTVCVTPERRAQVKHDNSQADARREPRGGPYGAATCISGYVWREAREGDVVCVTPEERARIREENRTADSRRVGGSTPID